MKHPVSAEIKSKLKIGSCEKKIRLKNFNNYLKANRLLLLTSVRPLKKIRGTKR
jgi:hypothetical protein